MEASGSTGRRPGYAGWRVALLLTYCGAVLGVDTLAALGVRTPLDWTVFRWHTASGIDPFKLVAWLALPLAFSARGLDAGWFGTGRWRRVDWALLGGGALAGAIAVASVAVLPGLRDVYPSLSGLPAQAKADYAVYSLLWTLSWLPGWEFLHRYVLLRAVDSWRPHYGWVMVPCVELAYHLQKPLPEAVGMFVAGLAFTAWARSRRNGLWPFAVHLAIELELLVFLVVV